MTAIPDSKHPRADSILLIALIVALVPMLTISRVGLLLESDTYSYVEYWHKLVSGIRHESSLHEAAPKAVPIVFYGVLFDLTGNFISLAWATIALGALGIAFTGRCVHAAVGRMGARLAVVLVAVQPNLVRQMLEGSSAVLEIFFLSSALLVWQSARKGHVVLSGLLLLAGGLCRPDVWPLYAIGLGGSVFMGRDYRAVARCFSIAALAPVLWFTFDGALTGNPFFSFQDTMVFAERHGVAAPTPSWISGPFKYAASLMAATVGAVSGPVLLLAASGLFWITARAKWLGCMFLLCCTSTFLFYFLPYRSGVPLLERFLLLPIYIAAVTAGPGLLVLSTGLRRHLLESQPDWIKLTRLASPWLLLSITILHPLGELRSWVNGTGTLFASATAEMQVSLAWIAEHDSGFRGRRLLVAARRKGLAVIDLGLGSDQVKSFRLLSPPEDHDLADEVDYILYDSRDLPDVYAEEWSFLVDCPSGFRSLKPDDGVQSVRIYQAERIE